MVVVMVMVVGMMVGMMVGVTLVAMMTFALMSVTFTFVTMALALVAVTFAIPDTAGTLGAGAFDVQYIWQTATSDKWAEFMLVIACVAQLFCGLASVTSASRMMFAFSRDGAVPGHKAWKKVAANRVPVNAVVAIGVLSFALMIPTYWNAYTGYLVGTSIAVIGLYIAFILPVILRWRKKDDEWEPGAWSLGKHYKWIDTIALLWVAGNATEPLTSQSTTRSVRPGRFGSWRVSLGTPPLDIDSFGTRGHRLTLTPLSGRP